MSDIVQLDEVSREGLSAVIGATREAEGALEATRQRVQRVLGSILARHGDQSLAKDNGSAQLEIVDIEKGLVRIFYQDPAPEPVKPGTVLEGRA